MSLFGIFSEFNFFSPEKRDEYLKESLDKIDKNAALRSTLGDPMPLRNDETLKRLCCKVKEVPEIITSSELVGTVRARARHYEAYLDYSLEEEALKTVGAPIFPLFYRDESQVRTVT
eukprot:CAMPEP_0185025272 /NCGR_PEP_ID=MMETSP1103-20130426/8291_1 /TAXON_ID=36769 /ORGANISM="Paraphysomonas bandaiensis, Strain Caron Lab Isolate" /LENGTH=116 /DNA_ID=CAMNT_0027558427 /DNA_START=65 /DNA_END=415 /DNA_ORIENTATION=+